MDLPRVALLVETSLGYGRRFLRGVIRYARLQGAWGLYINPADLRQLLPRMEEWGGTGIIARLETPEVERAVLATGLPTIALDLTARQLRAGSPTATMHEVRPDSHAAGRLAAEHLLDLRSRRLEGGGVAVRTADLERLDPQLLAEVCAAIWRREDWPRRDMKASHYLALADLMRGPGQAPWFDLPGGIRARCGGGELVLEPRATRPSPPACSRRSPRNTAGSRDRSPPSSPG